MAIGNKIEERNHIVGFKEEISAATKNDDKFFTWFDEAEDAQASFIKGAWDFGYHIAYPAINYLKNPQDKVALEIGVGGGRLLASASRYFAKAIGVDIHDNLDLTRNKLEMMGCANIEVLKCDGASVPVPSGSIDFVYSFIVFNHMEKVSIVKSYLDEVARILKPGGIAIIYFGRFAPFSHNRKYGVLYFLDRIFEVFYLRNGYRELPARVNCTNLLFTLGYLKSQIKNRGFQIRRTLSSRKKVPNEVGRFGMQHGIVFQKD